MRTYCLFTIVMGCCSSLGMQTPQGQMLKQVIIMKESTNNLAPRPQVVRPVPITTVQQHPFNRTSSLCFTKNPMKVFCIVGVGGFISICMLIILFARPK